MNTPIDTTTNVSENSVTDGMPSVTFVGAGPGAADLITVRGLCLLQEADVVLYAGSLVHPVHLEACKASCACFDTASMDLQEQVRIMAQGAKAGQKVVRLHTGDPAMFGAINEQIRGLARENVTAQVVPGVSSVFAAAAALGCELTCPDVSQSVVLTRTKGRTPMPEKENAAHFAQSGATLVFFLSAGNIESLMQELMQQGGLSAQTPAAVVYRVSWPDERILRGCVGDIARQCSEAGIGRQALILVGEALGQQQTSSLLYDGAFSHGYRNTLKDERFEGSCALYAFSEGAIERAQEVAAALGNAATIYTTRPDAAQELTPNVPPTVPPTVPPSVTERYPLQRVAAQDFDRLLREQWAKHKAHIFVSATGIAVRKVAPLLKHKSADPAVVVCSENGAFSVSLVSGHLGGANALSRRIARITGGQAVVSTATDGQGLSAFDAVAMQHKARILNVQNIKYLNAALLHKEPIAFYGARAVYDAHYAELEYVHFVTSEQELQNTSCLYAVIWQEEAQSVTVPENCTTLLVNPKVYVLGMGCRKGMDAHEFACTVQDFLAENGLTFAQVAAFATCDVKAQEQAMLALSTQHNIPLELHRAGELDAVPVPSPSKTVKEKVGTASVCEAAALLSAQNRHAKAVIHTPKKSWESMTLALVTMGDNIEQAECTVLVVGLGSGAAQHITPQVQEALQGCDVVAGYTKYVDFIRENIGHKPLIQSGMTGEVQRCTEALRVAATGKSVCMVCSGDPGILAMAGLLLELKARDVAFGKVHIKVLPGITAASLAAASLGAPLQNGYSLVSLSDLLVPAQEVRQNIMAVAASALPVVLYNPAGKKRRALLNEALQIFTKQRGANTWCAYVRHAGRPQEEKWVGRLEDFPEQEVDMATLVLIGSARTVYTQEMLYEARGYADKYL